MNILNQYKGNFLIAGVGLGIAMASKKIFKKEILPVSSRRQVLLTFSGITFATFVGKMIMLKLKEEKKLGFDKDPDEGFIGPWNIDGFPYEPYHSK